MILPKWKSSKEIKSNKSRIVQQGTNNNNQYFLIPRIIFTQILVYSLESIGSWNLNFVPKL